MNYLKFISFSILAGLVVPAVAVAQMYSGSISGGMFTSTVVTPSFDSNHADDILTQINNFTIQAINYNQSGGSAVITATGEVQVQCFAYPCYPQTNTYYIRTFSTTSFLLKNRAWATLSALAVGDRINAYGYLDRDDQVMDALIVRDLDKPAVAQYVQIDNVQVQNVPGPYAPTSFTVSENTQYCPYQFFGGVCPFTTGNSRTYQIQVSFSTTLLYANRTAMPLPEIRAGDRVNVYGVLNPTTNTVDATVIRNLSRDGNIFTPPPMSTNQAPVITSVSGPNFLPLGQNGTWTISAYDPDTTQLTYYVRWGDELYGYGNNAAAVPQLLTQTGTFTHAYAMAGTYTVTFTVADQYGKQATSTLTVTVSGSGQISVPQLNQLSPIYGPVGSYVTVYGSGFASTGNIVYFGSGAITGVSSYDGKALSFLAPQYLSPYCAPGMYCAQYVVNVTPGTYEVSIDNGFSRSNVVTFGVQ